MARKRRTEADLLNQQTFRVLYEHYKAIAMNMFRWEGLPEGITERFLEKTLFEEGKILFFRDPAMSYMTLPCGPGPYLDVYGEPLRWRAMGMNYNREYKREDCVLIENNKLRIPTADMVSFFVRKLYEAERTMDTNLTTCKVPFLFTCDEKQVLTYKEVFRRIDANEPAIFGVKGLAGDEIGVLPTKGVFLGNELMDYSHSVENKLLTFLGVNCSPVDKKERLITDEAQSNDQLLDMNADLMLETRQAACEAINALFGLNVSVELRHKREEVTDDVAEQHQQSDR